MTLVGAVTAKLGSISLFYSQSTLTGGRSVLLIQTTIIFLCQIRSQCMKGLRMPWAENLLCRRNCVSHHCVCVHVCVCTCVHVAVHYNSVLLWCLIISSPYFRFIVCRCFLTVFQPHVWSDDVDKVIGCLAAVFSVVYSFELLLLAILV